MDHALVIDIETWPETDKVIDLFTTYPPVPERKDWDWIKSSAATDAATAGNMAECKKLCEQLGVKIGAMKDPEKIAVKINDAAHAEERRQDKVCDPVKAKEDARAKTLDKACLKGHLSRIYGWGARDANFIDDIVQVLDPTRKQETALLTKLIGVMSDHIEADPDNIIVGWNTEGFDIPMIMQRAVILGVKVPFKCRMPLYYNDWSCDLMRQWSMSNHDFTSLGNVAKALGLGGKVPTSGKLPWELAVESKAQAYDYLKKDIDLTWSVGERMLGTFIATA